jgi:hypothetical protein
MLGVHQLRTWYEIFKIWTMLIGNEIRRKTYHFCQFHLQRISTSRLSTTFSRYSGWWKIRPLHPTMCFHGPSDCKDVSAFLFASCEPISYQSRSRCTGLEMSVIWCRSDTGHFLYLKELLNEITAARSKLKNHCDCATKIYGRYGRTLFAGYPG